MTVLDRDRQGPPLAGFVVLRVRGLILTTLETKVEVCR
jgi:hypothetical protein